MATWISRLELPWELPGVPLLRNGLGKAGVKWSRTHLFKDEFEKTVYFQPTLGEEKVVNLLKVTETLDAKYPVKCSETPGVSASAPCSCRDGAFQP